MPETAEKTTEKYIQTIGRRKRSVAQVRLFEGGTGKITVNGRTLEEHLPVDSLKIMVNSPFVETGTEGQFDVTVKVLGGGISGQAGAIRLGITRALVVHDETRRATLKKLGFLTRDARKRERKKFGKKSARRSPQWSKR